MVPRLVKEELLISREPALPWPHGEDRNQDPLSASVWAGETGGGSGVGQRGALSKPLPHPLPPHAPGPGFSFPLTCPPSWSGPMVIISAETSCAAMHPCFSCDTFQTESSPAAGLVYLFMAALGLRCRAGFL